MTRRSVKRSAALASSLVVGQDFFAKVGTVPLKPLPCVFSLLAEDPMKRRTSHDQTTRAAAFAAIDDRKRRRCGVHLDRSFR